MKPGTIAIFNSNDQAPRSGDAYHNFRQNAGLFWLTGIDQEETMLLLFPILRARNTRKCSSSGAPMSTSQFGKATNTPRKRPPLLRYEKVFFLDESEKEINELILLSEGIYLNLNENDRFLSPVVYRDLRYAHSIQNRYPAHTIHRSQPILKRLMTVKNTVGSWCDSRSH